MRLSLYIFNSSGAYLGALALTAALVVASAAALVFTAKALGRETFANQALLEYQFGKIGKGTAPEIVFVGDSSLGNAIDATEWKRLSGIDAVNLALSASFGFEGTYNMLRRVADWTKPKHVVIFQTGQLMQRPHREDGYIMTAPGIIGRLVSYWRMSMSAQQVEDATRWLAEFLMKGKPPPSRESIIINDYVMQAAQRSPNQKDDGWSPSSIKPEKAAYLKMIGSFCREQGLDCLYVHGPLVEPICSRSDAYFATVTRIVEEAGIRLVGSRPLCVPEHEVGDGENHVHPDLKAEYTRRYFELIGPELRR
jgi:hypothetical protein